MKLRIPRIHLLHWNGHRNYSLWRLYNPQRSKLPSRRRSCTFGLQVKIRAVDQSRRGHRGTVTLTRIMGILLTMDADMGVEAIQIIKPLELIPIHYNNDYEVFKSFLEGFKSAVTAAGLNDRVKYLSHGETYRFDNTQKD